MTQTVVLNPDKSKPFTMLVNVSNFANTACKGSMKRPQRIKKKFANDTLPKIVYCHLNVIYTFLIFSMMLINS